MRLAFAGLVVAFALALAAASCSSGAASTTTTASSASSSSGGGGAGGAGGAGGGGGAAPFGGDRPVDVYVPSGVKPGVPAPLVILLHGYSVNGTVQDLYFGLTPAAEKHGFYYAHPTGTINQVGNYFWNATDACCNFYGSTVDDSAYLASLIAEIQARYDVDPKRIYLIGHSNGGYMSYRMACDHADTIAAIATLAGAMWDDKAKCPAMSGTTPVSVLQIHGTADTEVPYDGAPAMGGTGATPSAETTVLDWAQLDGCVLPPDQSSPPLDLDTQLPGAETTVEKYTGCKPGGGAELWSIVGGAHIPNVADNFREDIIAWLMAHPKP